MEKLNLDQEIPLLCVTANSFPEGISEAFNKLHSLLPPGPRRIFGMSRPENNGSIVYRACAEELEKDEAKHLGCQNLIIKKGDYISLHIKGIRKDPMAIGRAFEQLLKQPGMDPEGYCVEVYSSDFDSVRCMIRLMG